MSLSRNPKRLRNITATEMGALFGLNPYSSPAKVLENKLNPTEINNNHVRRGKLKEPSVIEAFRLDTKMSVDRYEGGTIEMPDARIAATPDAFVSGTNNVVECKSVTTHSFEKWYDAVPLYYHMQVMTQMLVSGSEHGYIGALEEGDPRDCEYRFSAWEIQRDAEIEKFMREEVLRFWDHVDKGSLFRVNSKVKSRVLEILPGTSKLIYPHERPVKTDAKKLSDILAVFE